MGVDRRDYLIYGYKLPYEVENSKGEIIDFEEDFDKYLHNSKNFTIIEDGMCGDYTVMGLSLNCSDEYEGWGFTDIDISKINKKELEEKIIEVMGETFEQEPSLFIFSYFN